MDFKIFSLAALFSAAVLLVSVLSVPAGPAHAFTSTPANKDQRTIVQKCREDFDRSSAGSSCSKVTFTKVMNYRCRIDYTCSKADGGTRKGWKTIDPDDSASLKNCDGWLKTSC